MNPTIFFNTIMQQIKDYLDGVITKEEYYSIAEPYYSKYASVYTNKSFHDYFISSVADACTFYIDEPGSSPEEKEQNFREVLNEAYIELQNKKYQ